MELSKTRGLLKFKQHQQIKNVNSKKRKEADDKSKNANNNANKDIFKSIINSVKKQGECKTCNEF